MVEILKDLPPEAPLSVLEKPRLNIQMSQKELRDSIDKAEVDLRSKISRKDNLIKALRRYPNNVAKAAGKVGISRSEAIALMRDFRTEFEDLEEEQFDALEEMVMLAAKGELDPEAKGCGFKTSEALKILQLRRPRRWGATAGTQAERRKQGSETGMEAMKMVQTFMKGNNNGK